MQTINVQTIESLKAAGHMFAAGALAFALRMSRESYGCHYGMRSTYESDKLTFQMGWDSAQKH